MGPGKSVQFLVIVGPSENQVTLEPRKEKWTRDWVVLAGMGWASDELGWAGLNMYSSFIIY